MKKAIDVVNKNIVTVKLETSFEEIINIMKKEKIGKLPVVENNEVVGVITRNDILVKEEKAPLPPVIAFWDVLVTIPGSKSFEEKMKKISGYTAQEIMTKSFYRVDKNDLVSDVVTEILEKGYGYAVVYDDGNFIGLITKQDLITKSF